MDPTELQRKITHVSQLLAERLGAKGTTLKSRLQSRIRALPRRVRRAAQAMARAETVAGNPKLVRQIDARALERDYRRCLSYLEPLGKGLRLRGLALDIAASLALVAVFTAVAMIWWVRLHGMN